MPSVAVELALLTVRSYHEHVTTICNNYYGQYDDMDIFMQMYRRRWQGTCSVIHV